VIAGVSLLVWFDSVYPQNFVSHKHPLPSFFKQ
jgi:hypothetical protein